MNSEQENQINIEKQNQDSFRDHIKWYHRWIAGFAILVIPIFTLLFASKQSPFDYTLSQIGNFFGQEHRFSFIVWGIVVGGCFLVYISYLFLQANFRNRRALRSLILSDVFLILTVLTPSIKEIFPFLTRLHMAFSIAFALSLVGSIAFFIDYLSEMDEKISHTSWVWGLIIIGGSLISLFIFGKTGIFEIFFLLSFTIFLIILGGWLRREELVKKIQESVQHIIPEQLQHLKSKSEEDQLGDER